jgi:hypothetical protein
LDDLGSLVFKPIVREISMVFEDKELSEMCGIVITQNTKTQKFVLSEDIFKLEKEREEVRLLTFSPEICFCLCSIY